MYRFAPFRALTALLLAAALTLAHAAGLADISGSEATAGLKEALVTGADYAISSLGKKDGYLGNGKVKIPLPDSLKKIEKGLKALGMGKQADELVTTMNRAAERAVVEARPILLDAVRNMTVSDAKDILTGGDDSVTRFFRKSTSEQLGVKFLPIVQEATRKVQLADKYNKFAGQAATLGLIDEKDADLDAYVTHKAMDGLFFMIAQKEKDIRKNPVAAGSDLLKKVFGALR